MAKEEQQQLMTMRAKVEEQQLQLQITKPEEAFGTGQAKSKARMEQVPVKH